MPRVSREQMRANRAAVVAAASALLRRGGPGAVTVDAVSRRAGLTHGGFYKQFASRAALLSEALDEAVRERRQAIRDLARDTGGTRPVSTLPDAYLSTTHRDNPDRGCVAAALVGHLPGDTERALEPGFRQAVDDLVDAVARDGAPRPTEAVLAEVALLVGALNLARATTGTPLSEQFLRSARASIDAIRTTPS